ncbi:coniferyl aldehyde dehydrogenase [Acinetobacter courvalinii]|uniref:coniferyl aldehyde dehydrogenase n=1 Tax=Acinetobacter courvalinii TaxID=280147 RepID=UPI003F56EA50
MNQEQLFTALNHMRQAHIKGGPASLELRLDRLARTKQLLLDSRHELLEAISNDFGHRNNYQSLMADVLSSVAAIDKASASLQEWMKNETVSAPVQGMKTEIQYQPLGVVGIISPWNFPLNLAFSPLASVFAAGNRAMLKPSELTPRTSELLAQLVPQYFSDTELYVVTGDADVGQAFSRLAFDHLVFTGSTNVGRHIMRAAAENLVPVTLELGGKSPVVIYKDADIQTAAERILTIKTFNSGQICLSPDYLMLPEAAESAFIECAQRFIGQIFPSFHDNDDYTSIVSDRHFERLLALIEDAKAKGATIVPLKQRTDEAISDAQTRKIVPVLILNATDEMLVMQEEIFGPLLPIKTYRDFEDVIIYINEQPRPLAAYYFGEDPAAQEYFAAHTVSGGLVINDVMTHVIVDDLPFGGVGASGMGAYHGIHGFRRFSHAKAVVVQNTQGESNLRLRAPYEEKLKATEALLP